VFFFIPPPKYFGASDTCHRPPFPVIMCKKKMIILSFFLDARDAATPRAVVSAGWARPDRRLRTAVCSAGRVESLVLHRVREGLGVFRGRFI
jgi:hypothetical protein